MSDCIPICENCLSYPGEYKFCPITGRCCRDNLLYESCSDFEQKRKPTNGDVIRQMSNEELAKILRMCKSCAYYGECLTDPNKNGQCYYGRLEWLNAPAEEGKDE